MVQVAKVRCARAEMEVTAAWLRLYRPAGVAGAGADAGWEAGGGEVKERSVRRA